MVKTIFKDNVFQLLDPVNLHDGDEISIINNFLLIQTEFTPHVKVADITIELYDDRVMRIIDFIQFIKIELLDKGITEILKKLVRKNVRLAGPNVN